MLVWTRRDPEEACEEEEEDLQDATQAIVAALQEDTALHLPTEDVLALDPDPLEDLAPDLDHQEDPVLDPTPEVAAVTERDPEAHLLATKREEEVKYFSSFF